MYTGTCGDGGRHWYGQGETCARGQVPSRLLAAFSCDCNSHWRKPPDHEPDCRAVKWAKERNTWIAANPEVKPPLLLAPVRAVRGKG